MFSGPLGMNHSWTNRLQSGRHWVIVGAIMLALIIGIHGTIHLLPDHGKGFSVSMQVVLLVLWGTTTLVALVGLSRLGRAYSSLAQELDTDPQIDRRILPDDERRILGPILDTPGVTQIEVIDRSGFSDAKVSQTLTSLRKRGLVYRERQGRTYRLYPGSVFDDGD